MAEPRRSWARIALGLAIVALTLLEVQALLHTLQSQARLRERVVHLVEGVAHKARARLVAAIEHTGTRAPSVLAQEGVAWGLGLEVEVFAPDGTPLAAAPQPAPVAHWPETALQETTPVLRTYGPVAGASPRLLTYAVYAYRDRLLVVRFANDAADLVEDMKGRQGLLIGHGTVLAVLLLAGALVLFPAPRGPLLTEPRGLLAYEEAMQRLRSRGVEESRRHEVERRHLEDEIQDQQAMTRAGELTGAIIHEVRNGLGTILGSARLLERGGQAEAEVLELAQSVREECETLEGVIRRFMEFIRSETLVLAPFDLGRLLSRVAAREARARPGAELILPPGDVGSLVADEELLERAFENLVRNAREAAGPRGLVQVGVARRDTDVVVSIADDGPGLPAQARDRLRPFVTTKPGGLGLGLPISLKLVRLHGGELSLGDAAPHGLIVTVRLPADGPPASAAAPRAR